MDSHTLSSDASSAFGKQTNALVRFAGHTGESMQLAGKRFARRLARDSATLAIVAEPLAAPAFQIRFGGTETRNAAPVDVLVVFDREALPGHLMTLRPGGRLLLNTRTPTAADLTHADVTSVPHIDTALDAYRVMEVDFDALTRDAVGDMTLHRRELERCRNYAALGVVCRLLEEATENIRCRTADTAPTLVRANRRALLAGYALGQNLAPAGRRKPRIPSVASRFAA
jgi:2-oxoglutarate ferredoxin oxidoreductase subunit alpha